MKLLTEQVGWAQTNQNLFWTTDDGKTWKDITPKTRHQEQTLSSVFFFNTTTGWAVLKCADGVSDKSDDTCFEFAATTDAGQSWSLTHPKIVDPDPEAGFSGRTYIAFADSVHGWAILKVSRSVAVSFGIMLRTEDGGKTWKLLPQPPIAETFQFISSADGWLLGGPDQALYVTHNGGQSWSRVAVKPPSSVKFETGTWPPPEYGNWPYYYMPIFERPNRGYLIGSYWENPNDPRTPKPAVAVFSTTDVGRTWKFERILPEIGGAFTILNGALFEASTPRTMDKITLTRLPLSAQAVEPARVTAEVHGSSIRHYNLGAGSDRLEMSSEAHGWLSADDLLATSNDGVTWTDITPGGPTQEPRRVPGEVREMPMGGNVRPLATGTGSSALGVR